MSALHQALREHIDEMHKRAADQVHPIAMEVDGAWFATYKECLRDSAKHLDAILAAHPDPSAEVEALRAKLARVEALAESYRAALQWIVDVNAMNYEYRKVARAALKDTTP